MTTARFGEAHENARAAGRPSASAADLAFTLRVTLGAALAKLGLVAFALLGGGA
jgi:hypothetical protein